jgi:hypothetical protein
MGSFNSKKFHTSKIVHALGWRQLSYRADSSPTISSSKRKRRIPGDDNDGDDWRDRCLSLSLLPSRSRAPDSSLVAVNKKRFPSPRDVRRKSVQFHSIPKWQIMMSLFGPFLILLLGLPLLAPRIHRNTPAATAATAHYSTRSHIDLKRSRILITLCAQSLSFPRMTTL